MNDEQILQRGGTEEDIENYANLNGADLKSEDSMYCTSGCGCPYPYGNGSHERDCVWKEIPKQMPYKLDRIEYSTAEYEWIADSVNMKLKNKLNEVIDYLNAKNI